MSEYEILRLIWWALLGVLLIGFAVMDGFDLGTAALLPFVARTDLERRVAINTIGPVWEGNQVWFITAGGATFAAWPLLYAASFSGLYLAMFLLLLALILRPVGFASRDKLTDPRWRAAWDWALTAGGTLPALLFGVAFGNLFLGLPFHFDALQRPIGSGGFFSLLHPFALLAGVISLSMLTLHGTAYAAMKVGEPMATRAREVGRFASIVFLLTFVVAGLWGATVLSGFHIIGGADHFAPSDPTRKTVETLAGDWLNNFRAWPWMWSAPLGAVTAAVCANLLLRLRLARAAFMA